ncbi:hypothetical protein GGI17_005849 [Coemansia sp. S146]|nr:hypothetical protein GGI17_005849 [Coemansia sp. S146]
MCKLWFSHKHFQRRQSSLLDFIRRKQNARDTTPNDQNIADGTTEDNNGEALSSKLKRLEDENRLLRAQARAADEQAKLQQKTIDVLMQLVVCVVDNVDSGALANLGQQQQQQYSSSSGPAMPMVEAIGFGGHPQQVFETMGLTDMLDTAQQLLTKRQRLSPNLTRSVAHDVGDDSTPRLRHKVSSPQSTALISTLHVHFLTSTQLLSFGGVAAATPFQTIVWSTHCYRVLAYVQGWA